VKRGPRRRSRPLEEKPEGANKFKLVFLEGKYAEATGGRRILRHTAVLTESCARGFLFVREPVSSGINTHHVYVVLIVL